MDGMTLIVKELFKFNKPVISLLRTFLGIGPLGPLAGGGGYNRKITFYETDIYYNKKVMLYKSHIYKVPTLI